MTEQFEALPKSSAKPDIMWEDAEGKLRVNQKLVAEMVATKTRFFSTSQSLSGYWYNGQYWENIKTRSVRDIFLKSEISKILEGHVTANLLRSILELILGSTYKDNLKYAFQTKPSLVSFKNTAVDGDTMEFIPNSPELYILGGFDFEIKTDMNVGKTLNLFTETLGENHKFMIEFFGSMFHRDYRPFQYAVIITGQAGAGKSYLVELIRKFLGEEMTTSLSLEQITTDRFMVSEMYGSYANIKSDLNNKFIPSFDIINNLTGADSIQAQHKGENSFSFTNHAKLLFTANEAPAIKSNEGIRRRIKILIAKSSPHVAKSDDDDNYTEFMKERGSFVYYAMSLYMEAKNRRKMSLTQDIEDATAEWFLQGDDIESWAHEHLIEDTNSRPRSNWLYNELKYYWAENGLEKVPSSKVVMSRLRELGYDIRKNNAKFPNVKDGNDKGQVAQRVMGVRYSH
ncbi:DNA primase family protein [Leuconostoc suionicum]|uniref:DNA primase family protein n=1 Tax=Leuconostoc suionicum TaxID=1511761 RepID=UPI003C6ADC98